MFANIGKMMNAGQAAAYFDSALAIEDYYTPGREISGQWLGKGASRLGLTETVERADFVALLNNRTPAGGKLTPRDRAPNKGIACTDITVSVPKSVSIQYGITQDPAILACFEEANRLTLAEIEKAAQTAVTKGKAKGARPEFRKTGNLIVASFQHYTARPVEGAVDPQLHRHNIVMNGTYDAVEGRFKALQNQEIFAQSNYWKGFAVSKMAELLQERGYRIRRTRDAFELEGYTDALIDKFSRRRAQVEARAAELGITDDSAKARLGRMTRSRKESEFTAESQRVHWLGRLSAEERAIIEAARPKRRARGETGRITPSQALEHALAHHLERASVKSEHDVIGTALRFSVGELRVEELRAEFDRRVASGALLTGRGEHGHLVTTPEVVAEERAMLQWAREGKGQLDPISGMRALPCPGELDAHQAAAINHILDSKDRLTMIAGMAGSGKSSVMQRATAEIERSGRRVFLFTPGSELAEDQRDKGLNTRTLATLLNKEELRDEVRGEVIWVDEASKVAVPDMAALTRLAREQDCRVILSGDTAQHGPVARGDAMRLFRDRAAVKSVTLEEIYRQKPADYKQAVAAAARGDTASAFAQLESIGQVRECEDHRLAAAERYLEIRRDGRESSFVICPTHAEGEIVGEHIRAGLRSDGALKGPDQSFARLRKVDLTDAQRGDPMNYRAGQLVQPRGRIPGMKPGARYEVVQAGQKGVSVRTPGTKPRALNLEHASAFDVYERCEMQLAAGDEIRITRNGAIIHDGKKRNLTNGREYAVKAITPEGNIRLGNGWVLPGDYGHIRHSYVATSYARQGPECDRVVACQSAGSMANKADQLYVTISRGKLSAEIYTDNRAQLASDIERSSTRLSATELTARPAPESDATRLQRAAVWARQVQTAARQRAQYLHQQALTRLRSYRERHDPGIA